MCEIIRRMLMKRFQVKWDGMRDYGRDICPKIQVILETNKRTSFEFIIYWDGQDEVEVEESTSRRCIVNLTRRSCSCRKWDLNGIPCAHACVGIFRTGGQPELYVDNYYKKGTLLKAYEKISNVIPDPSEWEECSLLRPEPPIVRVQLGRTKKARKRAVDELINQYRLSRSGVQIKCGRCGQPGHNATTCRSRDVDPCNIEKAMHEATMVNQYSYRRRSNNEENICVRSISNNAIETYDFSFVFMAV